MPGMVSTSGSPPNHLAAPAKEAFINPIHSSLAPHLDAPFLVECERERGGVLKLVQCLAQLCHQCREMVPIGAGNGDNELRQHQRGWNCRPNAQNQA
ncbi:hypothetical protein FRC11_011605, partial [Ceratobasidium sp. 423]